MLPRTGASRTRICTCRCGFRDVSDGGAAEDQALLFTQSMKTDHVGRAHGSRGPERSREQRIRIRSPASATSTQLVSFPPLAELLAHRRPAESISTTRAFHRFVIYLPPIAAVTRPFVIFAGLETHARDSASLIGQTYPEPKSRKLIAATAVRASRPMGARRDQFARPWRMERPMGHHLKGPL